MISFPEQFSAARLTQLDNGFQLMRSLSEQALDRTSRVFALQLDASRAAVEQSSNTMRQLLSARDPRDLMAIGSQSQQQLRSIFDYSRELFSIAAGVDPTVARSYRVATPVLNAPAGAEAAVQEDVRTAQAAAEAFERIGGDTASATASDTASATASEVAKLVADTTDAVTDAVSDAVTDAAPSIILQADAPPAAVQSPATDIVLPSEISSATAPAAASATASATAPATASATASPNIEVVTSDIAPAAAPTAIAKATSEALDVPVAPPHPLAASVPVEVTVEIELPKVEPAVAAPLQAVPSTGPVETRGTKGRRKPT